MTPDEDEDNSPNMSTTSNSPSTPLVVTNLNEIARVEGVSSAGGDVQNESKPSATDQIKVEFRPTTSVNSSGETTTVVNKNTTSSPAKSTPNNATSPTRSPTSNLVVLRLNSFFLLAVVPLLLLVCKLN